MGLLYIYALAGNKLLTQTLTSKCVLLGNTQLQKFTFLPIKHKALHMSGLVQLPTKEEMPERLIHTRNSSFLVFQERMGAKYERTGQGDGKSSAELS